MTGRCRAAAWLVVCLACLVVNGGCASFHFFRDPTKIGKRTPCGLPNNPTLADVVDHVNANVEKVHSWRSDNISIRAHGVPIALHGSMFVERDRHLRLEVASPMGKEVDFGSNDDVFWIWAKRNRQGNEPAPVMFVSHSDLDLARQRLPMPFEPEWLMEALGVTPLSSEGVHLDGEPGRAEICLVSQHQLSDGHTIRKLIKVHGCHGYVMEHTISDLQGRALVRAVMNDYRLDTRTGAILPRYIKLDWPQAEMSLAMEFGPIEVNPSSVPPTVWEMPHMPQTPVINLAAGISRPARVATAGARSRNELTLPEQIPTISHDESFELPQVSRGQAAVELEGIDFEQPATTEPPGSARLDAWDE